MTEIKIPEHLQHQFDRAKEELGEESYYKRLVNLFSTLHVQW